MSHPLADVLPGRVLTRDAAGFAAEVAGFNSGVVHRPEVVVAAETVEDVLRAVRFARQRGLPVNVQATGHGHAPAHGGVFISTRRLDHVRIDTARRMVTAGAGAQWGAVVAAAAEHGLAPISGSSPTVGVVGYLLGGGLGPLARSHGFSSDYLARATVVTGTGELVEASTRDHEDLFWALRGGKHGLGVVTEVDVRLVALPALYAGALFFDEPQIEAALRAWIDWTQTADARVTTSAAIVRFPPLEAVPSPLRGRRMLSLRFAFAGASDEGQRLAAPLRAAAIVHLDTLGPLPLAEVARIHSDPTHPVASWVTGRLLTHLDQRLASVMLASFGPGTDAPFVATELRHIGEATRRDVPEGSAVGGRAASFTLGMVSVDAARFASEVPRAADSVTTALADWIAPITNINFAPQARTAEELAHCWPPAIHSRLEEVRRTYDPHGLTALA